MTFEIGINNIPASTDFPSISLTPNPSSLASGT